MVRRSEWDWQVGERVILDTTSCTTHYEWQEEIYTSSDGESIGAVVKLDNGGFTVCRNGVLWDNVYDRVWYLRYSHDDSLTALVSDGEKWALSVNDKEWALKCDYIWDTRFSSNGESVAVAIQDDMKYGMALNGEVWPELFANANNFVLSPDGSSTAAVAQISPIRQAELSEFQSGCYSVVVNGIPWSEKFTNVWSPVFDPNNIQRVAAQVRMGLYDYTIAVNGKPWEKTFKSVWEPSFSLMDSSVSAPVRENGLWGLAVDGKIVWDPVYFQLWKQQFLGDGKRVAAVAAVKFGEWTVVVNNTPWKSRFQTVTDLSIGNNDQTIAVAVCEKNMWSIAVNDKPWATRWDRVWAPVISPAGSHVAAKVQQGGGYTVALDGKPMDRKFTRVWEPEFSPDGEKVLVRGVIDGKYLRIVKQVSEWG